MEHYKDERTLVIIKPDGVQRTLIGEIIGRYEKLGLKLIGLKINIPSEEQIEKHYTIDSDWKQLVGEKAISSYKEKGLKPPSDDPIKVGDRILERLKKYMTSGPVICMVWQGAHCIELIRKLTGGTEPRSSDVGTIRGDYVLDSYQMADTDNRAIRNLIHASSSTKEANDEINLWFEKGEILSYRLIQEQIIYNVNIDSIIE